MITVEIPIRDSKKPPKFTFPQCCVHCGKPKAKTLPIKLNTGAQKRGQIVQLEMDVPVCSECAAKEDRIANVTWMPFFIAGLLAFVIVFIPVLLLSPEGTTSQTLALPYLLGAAAGLLAGLLIGTLAEFVLKMLFAHAYGKWLLKRPLTVFAVFKDAEDLIGLSARFADSKRKVKLSFENDEIAREFVALNPQENS